MAVFDPPTFSTSAMLEAEALTLDIKVLLNAASINGARNAITDLSRRFLEDGDDDLGERLGMATHELLENSYQHGLHPTSVLSFRVHGRGKDRTICLSVRNQVRPSQVDVLRHVVSEVGSADDAWAFYAEAMRRTATRTTGSGLGLARIRAEGEMEVRLEFDGEYACVEAAVLPGGAS